MDVRERKTPARSECWLARRGSWPARSGKSSPGRSDGSHGVNNVRTDRQLPRTAAKTGYGERPQGARARKHSARERKEVARTGGYRARNGKLGGGERRKGSLAGKFVDFFIRWCSGVNELGWGRESFDIYAVVAGTGWLGGGPDE